MTDLLKVEDLSVSFYSDKKIVSAVNNVSFVLPSGETLALVGESGSGKSVTAYSILKLLPLEKLAVFKGKIFFQEKNLLEQPSLVMNKVRGGEIGIIFQDPMNSLNPTQTIFRQVAESILLHQSNLKMNKSKTQEKVLNLLSKVELPHPTKFLDRFPHELSGGQKQRVMIAIALANDPTLLIADEPTTALDVTVQIEILKLLNQLKKEMNLSLLFITHDLSVVREIADHIVVMKEGMVVEKGLAKELFSDPQHPFSKLLFHSKFKLKNSMENSVAFDSSSKLSEKTNKVEEKKKLVRSPLLQVDALRVEFPIYSKLLKIKKDKVVALSDISFDLWQGETLGVIGESGSGKTTLAMALLQLIESQGEIFFRDQLLNQLKKKDLRKIRKNLQIVFQDSASSLNPRMPVATILREGLDEHYPEMTILEKESKINQMLQEVGLHLEQRNHYPHEFSGGQRQRINIARALILNPDFMILDEPTSSLDFLLQIQIVNLLLNLQKKYSLTYIFISHDLRVVQAIADKIIVLKEGKCVEAGETRKIFYYPQNDYTKLLIKSSLL